MKQFDVRGPTTVPYRIVRNRITGMVELQIYRIDGSGRLGWRAYALRPGDDVYEVYHNLVREWRDKARKAAEQERMDNAWEVLEPKEG